MGLKYNILHVGEREVLLKITEKGIEETTDFYELDKVLETPEVFEYKIDINTDSLGRLIGIEEGTHDLLLSTEGKYAELYKQYFEHQSLEWQPRGLVKVTSR